MRSLSGAIAETPTASSIAEDSAGPAADIPAYSGEPYAIINDNIPLFSDSAERVISFQEL